MNKKTSSRSKEFSHEREFTVMLESMRDDIKLIAEGQKAIPAIKEKVDTMWEEMGHQREDITIIKTVVRETRSDVNLLKSDVSTLKSNMAEVKATLNDHGKRLDRIESDVNVLKTDLVEVKGGLGRVESDVSEIKDTVKGHDKRLANL